jgi:hypothetical protein
VLGLGGYNSPDYALKSAADGGDHGHGFADYKRSAVSVSEVAARQG